MNNETKNHFFEFLLRLGDTSLVSGQRLAEWCGHGPILEEDIALTNISLDLIGQARAFLTYAGEIEGKGRTEDDLAYLRDNREFRNVLLAEQDNGDFGKTILRQFFLSTYQYFLFRDLSNSKDEKLAAIAAKSLKEVTYHLRHTSEWVVRLGDGTEESHRRMNDALDDLWRYTGDMFAADETDRRLLSEGIGIDYGKIQGEWTSKVKEIFTKSTLTYPEETFFITGSREGRHTEHLGHMLAEMQVLPRSFPDAKW